MARRSNGRLSGVRGPNSALTEFLRVEGITDAFRRRQDRRDSSPPDQSVTEEIESDEREAPPTDDTVEVGTNGTLTRDMDEDEREIRVAARRKMRAAKRRLGGGFPGDSDDDDDDENDDDYSDDDVRGNGFRNFGEEDTCVDCSSAFIMTVYSRYDGAKKGYLCETCNEKLRQRERAARKNQLNARKKRKKMAQALLDKSTVQMPSLQDICIKKITENIDDVDALGDIGQANMDKISMILSKNRSLNNSTMALFLNPGLKSLDFWDCSNVDSDSLNKIASYCPNLESLTLFMCGQLHNDNLKYYSSKLLKLTDLSLNGPFLISDIMWQEFFETGGSNLLGFEIRNTHRFGNDALISLLENCGSQLTKLKLSRLDGLDSAPVYELIPHYILTSKLVDLEISYPQNEELITDDLMINILSITGESLTSLNVDGCSYLTDRFLKEGIARFCPNLTHLSMKLLDQLSNSACAESFSEYSKVNSGGLISVQLTKCTGLGNDAIYSLLRHSAATLVELNLNSIYKIDKDFLFQIFTDDLHPRKMNLRKAIEESTGRNMNGNSTENSEEDVPKLYSKINLPLLTTLDIGFVRAVDDEILNFISEKCTKLSILEVYGNNRCSLRANVRKDLMVIGRQNDIL